MAALKNAGVGCSLSDLWPRKLYLSMNNGRLPLGRSIFRTIIAFFLLHATWQFVKRGMLRGYYLFALPAQQNPAPKKVDTLVQNG